jgi:hypothetical protein
VAFRRDGEALIANFHWKANSFVELLREPRVTLRWVKYIYDAPSSIIGAH